MKIKVPHWPEFSPLDQAAVHGILESGKVNYWNGRYGREFENRFGRYVGAEAVAVANGTVALEACLRALGVKQGDEVIVSPRTFVASASVVSWVGATPVFVDVDSDDQCITPASISGAITEKTRAIIVVHFAGHPAKMDDIKRIADAHNLFLIEDCAQAHGARYNGVSVGSIGDFGAWSFCTDKIMSTAGEGGMVTTTNKDLERLIWSMKDHGKNREKMSGWQPAYPMLHDSLGTNWRMTEIQAAIGLNQLELLDRWVSRRQINLRALYSAFSTSSAVRAPSIGDNVEIAPYKAYLFVQPSALKSGWNRDRIARTINEIGIPCSQGSCSEIYLEKLFRKHAVTVNDCSVAKELGQTALSFPVHHLIDDNCIGEMIGQIRLVLAQAVRPYSGPRRDR